MRSVFLGEGAAGGRGSLGMDTQVHKRRPRGAGLREEWLEVWDYGGDVCFRGFVTAAGPASGMGTGSRGERALVVFIDEAMASGDLKSG